MKRFLPLVTVFALTACGGTAHYDDPTQGYSAPAINSAVDSILAHEAAQATQARMMIARIERTKAPPTVNDPEQGAPPELLVKITELNWAGPVDGLLQSLADKVGYSYLKSDVTMNDTVMVNIDLENETVAKALDDIALQIQDREQVIVDPDQKTITLRLNGAANPAIPVSKAGTTRQKVLHHSLHSVKPAPMPVGRS